MNHVIAAKSRLLHAPCYMGVLSESLAAVTGTEEF